MARVILNPGLQPQLISQGFGENKVQKSVIAVKCGLCGVRFMQEVHERPQQFCHLCRARLSKCWS